MKSSISKSLWNLESFNSGSKATPAWKDENLNPGGTLALAYEYKPGNRGCLKYIHHARSRA